jgi:hypothetical protein
MKGFHFESVANCTKQRTLRNTLQNDFPFKVKAEIEQVPYKSCMLDTAYVLHIATVT